MQQKLQKNIKKVSVYRNFFLILHRQTNMITMEFLVENE